MALLKIVTVNTLATNGRFYFFAYNAEFQRVLIFSEKSRFLKKKHIIPLRVPKYVICDM